MIYIEPKS